MLKAVLCICAFGLCIVVALLLTRRYRQRKEFFYSLNLFNERLVNEVSYLRAPLSKFIGRYAFGGDFQKIAALKLVRGSSKSAFQPVGIFHVTVHLVFDGYIPVDGARVGINPLGHTNQKL